MGLACGHDGPEYGVPLCEHLRAADDQSDHVVRWTGDGAASDRICTACADRPDAGAGVVTAVVCEECFDRVDGGPVRAVGAPEVRERPVQPDRTIRETVLPSDGVPLADLTPLDGPGAAWLLLYEDGRIVHWSAESGARREVARASVAPDPEAEGFLHHVQRRRLHASADGRFAAVVIDHGTAGEVFDLALGVRTMVLDGGDHHAETVPFALAFTVYEGRPVVLHRTDWNRLGAADPATGRSLEGVVGEGGPLLRADDFFHGALHVSPGGSFVADDGWVWHPDGRCEVWPLAELFGDGSGPLLAATAAYHWNRPVAWLDDCRLAVGGLGDDDLAMVPGVRILDAARREGRASRPQAAEVAVFGGPDGPLFAADGLLFSVGPAGLTVWDPADGARLGTVPGFRPAYHHRAGGALVEVADGRLLRWRTA
ncbi:hypothetical protein [Kitasatospora sp. NPDC059571]|uniref:hypothetical protein n=1 Tax=Kitasatospora sp. NPDC059571 TaxID=3346871 RepID=UPI0036A45EAA